MYNMLIYLNMCLNTSAIHEYVVYYTLWFIVSSIYDLFNRFHYTAISWQHNDFHAMILHPVVHIFIISKKFNLLEIHKNWVWTCYRFRRISHYLW